MEKKRNILTLLLAFCMMASLAGPAFALEYAFDGAEGLAYGKSTSIEVPITADGGAMKNEDVSKNAARIPPTFGSPTSNTLDTGDYLTPNLAPAVMAATGPGAMINGSAVTVLPPSLDGIEMPAGSPGSSTGSSYVSAPARPRSQSQRRQRPPPAIPRSRTISTIRTAPLVRWRSPPSA